jgi:uncharacterized protein
MSVSSPAPDSLPFPTAEGEANFTLAPGLAAKRDRLLRLLSEAGRVGVAFSGGVDSSVVAQAAFLAGGDRAVAVTAVSASLASGELEIAKEVASRIGIRHVILQTDEFADPNYVRNGANRCYYCKTELYTQLEARRASLGIDTLVNGANTDDRGDHRPGMIAAAEHSVRSPLIEAGIGKSEVRELALLWNLPVWDKPASPCLSSRIAYGLEVTPERVARVDAAEQFLRAEFKLVELRVRHEPNDLARIEAPVDALPRLVTAEAQSRISLRLHELGFRYITLDLDGFRSGSLNAVLPLESLRIAAAQQQQQ